MTDDELKAIEGKVQAVNKPCSHHSTMQDTVIFSLLQTSVPALIAELHAAREALEYYECREHYTETPTLSGTGVRKPGVISDGGAIARKALGE